MKKLVVLAALLWCGTALAIPTWTGMGPGGGGNFTSADINGSNIVAASDNGGIFISSDGGSTWLRRGSLDGLPTNFIICVRFKPVSSSTTVLAGTEDGLYRSTDTGTSWNEVGNAIFGGKKITAIGWADQTNDPGRAWVAFRGDTSDVHVAFTEDSGTSWSSYFVIPAPTDSTVDDVANSPALWHITRSRLPVKIVADPAGYGADGADGGAHGRVVYVLLGQGVNMASTSASQGTVGREEIWRSRYDTHGSLRIQQPIRCVNGALANIIDIAHSPTAGAFAITTHDAPNALDWTPVDVGAPPDPNASGISNPTYGRVFTASTTADTGAVISWTEQALPQTWYWDTTAGGNDCYQVMMTNSTTGACWYSGSDLYVQSISQDACGGGKNQCDDGTDSTAAGRAGRYELPSGSSWSRVDDGRNTDAWEIGWATVCSRARGATLASNSMAATSQSLSPDGKMWVTGFYVWKYDGSKYVRVFTDHENSSPYNTTLIDNANAATIALDSDTYPLVGYYDNGLWKYDGTGWVNANSTNANWGNSAGTGGNVNGIAIGSGPKYVVTEAVSSKKNKWSVWTSGSGAFDSWTQNTGGSLPTGTFMRGLTYDGTAYWVTTGDATDKRAVWRATDPAGTWTKKKGCAGMLTIGANGTGTVLVGGLYELYRTTNNGTTWSTVSGIGKVTPTTVLSGDTTTSLHAMRWAGVQDIRYEWGNWYVTVWAPTAYSSGPKGVYVSTDDGQTFSKLGGTNSPADSVLRRAVEVDSCGLRYHITSGQMFCSPVDGTGNNYQKPAGVQTCRISGGVMTCVPDIADNVSGGHRSDQWGFTQAHSIVSYDDGLGSSNSTTVYALAPGYGTQRFQTTDGDCVELTGGGGGMSARRALEEGGGAAELPLELRQHLTVQQALGLVRSGRLELFDVSGRRAKEPRPGVYFSVKRDKAGAITQRRTVLVTR